MGIAGRWSSQPPPLSFNMPSLQSTSSSVSIREVLRKLKAGKINVSPYWQRSVVWTEKTRSTLIETILKGFPVNHIVFWDGVCVDGKNRIDAIRGFVSNEFYANDGSGYVTFSELSEKQQEDVLEFSLDTRELVGSDWNDVSVREFFKYIQVRLCVVL